jgi:RNA polymerase sigma factor (sigma-70 family)
MYRKRTAVRGHEERNALAVQWLGLVSYMMRKLFHRAAVRRRADDCRSAGYLALLRCAELWDETMTATFPSYALSAIRWRILHEAYPKRRVMLCGDLGDDDFAFDPAAPEREDAAPDLDRERLRQALTAIRSQYRFVLERRYGLDHQGGCVLDDLARELRVTRSRVGQIEQRAIDALGRGMDRLEEREGRP